MKRVATPALALLLTVAATGSPAEAATAQASAGVTWSKLMQRKLNTETEARRLVTVLPSLRTAVAARNRDVVTAQNVQVAATTTVTTAATADQRARTAHTNAKTAATTAKRALTTAKKQRPRSAKRIAKAQRTLDAANTTVRTRADKLTRTAAALRTARTSLAAANRQLTTATTAHQAAVSAVTRAELKIKSQPQLTAALAAQATAISAEVVTQTRANFTITNTTKVYGITVNKIVAYPFQRMIDDAAKAGVPLSGGGFRTKQRQIELRKLNGCPDIWTAPASSCRVPTAIPGRSLHEIGLAIDMTSGGKSITNRKSKAFKWLSANAGRYGLVNLPSEPWHWSITGN
ncbi:M15 family metallopeptidase [Actinoplanes sp. NPDC051861]|uniref:M15 family metallopeptidase n=1 Tax=Actinoplanes sp. NPDC051861 TaxID=3155170 RepID=UPI0034214CD7